MTSVREEAVDAAIVEQFARLQFSGAEKSYLAEKLPKLEAEWKNSMYELEKNLTLQLDLLQQRLDRLTDAYLDRVIDRETFEERKNSCLMERMGLDCRTAELRDNNGTNTLESVFELAESASESYKLALPEQKRDLLKILTSNRLVEQKNVTIEFNMPFREIANRVSVPNGSPFRDEVRTWDALLMKIFVHCKTSPPLLASD